MPLAGWAIVFHLVRALSGHAEYLEVRGAIPGPAAIATGSAARTTLDAATLGIIGPDRGRWLALARRSAGEPIGSPQFMQNGLPDPGAISSDTETITIGDDPFGVERAGAGSFAIDVADHVARSQWRVALRPEALSSDRADPSVPGATRSTKTRSFAVSGPVGRRVSFAGSVSGTSSRARPVYIAGIGAAETLAADVEETSASSEWRTRFAGRVGAFRWTAGLTHQQTDDDAAGLGGRIGPSSAGRFTARETSGDTSWRLSGVGWRWRGAARVTRSQRTIDAGHGPGLIYAGRRVSGAPDTVSVGTEDASAALVSVIEAAGPAPAWLVGVVIDSGARDESRLWNPDGQRFVERITSRGVLFTREGRSTTSVADRNAALFGQTVVVNTARAWIRVGLRVDFENGFRPVWSPRVSGGFAVGRWLIGANAGTFANRFDRDLRTEFAMRRAAPATIAGAEALMLVTEGAAARRRDLVVRASASRRVGPIGVMFEETTTFGRQLGGLRRLRDANRLLDRADPGGTLDRFESRIRVDAGGRRWSMTAHAQHTHSVDDTDGALSLPATALGRAGESGPSTGVSRWSVSAVAQTGAHGVRVLVSARLATGTPYSLLSGLDNTGLLTFSGRSAAARNAERFPAIRDLSIFMSRHVGVRGTPVGADIGLRLENLVGALTPLDVTRTAGSPLAGRAAGASAGRSVSIWLTLGRR